MSEKLECITRETERIRNICRNSRGMNIITKLNEDDAGSSGDGETTYSYSDSE